MNSAGTGNAAADKFITDEKNFMVNVTNAFKEYDKKKENAISHSDLDEALTFFGKSSNRPLPPKNQLDPILKKYENKDKKVPFETFTTAVKESFNVVFTG